MLPFSPTKGAVPTIFWTQSLVEEHFPTEWDWNNWYAILISALLLCFGSCCIWRKVSPCGVAACNGSGLCGTSWMPNSERKVIYTAHSVGGKHPGVRGRSSLCHIGSRTSFMDESCLAVKPLSVAGAFSSQNVIFFFTVCHLCRSTTYQSAFSSSVQTKCIEFPVSHAACVDWHLTPQCTYVNNPTRSNSFTLNVMNYCCP